MERKHTTSFVCEDCKPKAHQFSRRTYICVEATDRVWLGGHHTQDGIDESLRYSYWLEGMVFELWEAGQYTGAHRVVGPQCREEDEMGETEQYFEEEWGHLPKGDGVFNIVPGPAMCWFTMRGDGMLPLHEAMEIAQERLGFTPTSLYVNTEQVIDKALDALYNVVRTDYMLPDNFGLGV